MRCQSLLQTRNAREDRGSQSLDIIEDRLGGALIESDMCAADQHGQMHDSLQHMGQREVRDVAVFRTRIKSCVQTARESRDEVAMGQQNPLGKACGARGVADGAHVSGVRRSDGGAVLVANLHELLGRQHHDALPVRDPERTTCWSAMERVFSSMSPICTITFRSGARSKSIISLIDSPGVQMHVFMPVCCRMNSTESAPRVS